MCACVSIIQLPQHATCTGTGTGVGMGTKMRGVNCLVTYMPYHHTISYLIMLCFPDWVGLATEPPQASKQASNQSIEQSSVGHCKLHVLDGVEAGEIPSPIGPQASIIIGEVNDGTARQGKATEARQGRRRQRERGGSKKKRQTIITYSTDCIASGFSWAIHPSTHPLTHPPSPARQPACLPGPGL